MTWEQEHKKCVPLSAIIKCTLIFNLHINFFRPGCSMPEIWDVEDPANAGKPPLCNLLVKESKPHFTTVFQNSVYKVLEVIEEWPLPTEKSTSNGFHVLLITHALFLIQIPKAFISNCFQMKNVLFGQFECHSDCENTYTFISWLLFQCIP